MAGQSTAARPLKPFKCRTCDRSFTTRKERERHHLVHSWQKHNDTSTQSPAMCSQMYWHQMVAGTINTPCPHLGAMNVAATLPREVERVVVLQHTTITVCFQTVILALTQIFRRLTRQRPAGPKHPSHAGLDVIPMPSPTSDRSRRSHGEAVAVPPSLWTVGFYQGSNQRDVRNNVAVPTLRGCKMKSAISSSSCQKPYRCLASRSACSTRNSGSRPQSCKRA
jgi:hypothetical protein